MSWFTEVEEILLERVKHRHAGRFKITLISRDYRQPIDNGCGGNQCSQHMLLDGIPVSSPKAERYQRLWEECNRHV